MGYFACLVRYWSQTAETSKTFVHQSCNIFQRESQQQPAASIGLTVTGTRFTSCCQTIGRSLGSNLKAALVLLGKKTNLHIQREEQKGKLNKKLLKSLSSGWKKNNYMRKLNWFPAGVGKAGVAKPQVVVGVPEEVNGAQAHVPVRRGAGLVCHSGSLEKPA